LRRQWQPRFRATVSAKTRARTPSGLSNPESPVLTVQQSVIGESQWRNAHEWRRQESRRKYGRGLRADGRRYEDKGPRANESSRRERSGAAWPSRGLRRGCYRRGSADARFRRQYDTPLHRKQSLQDCRYRLGSRLADWKSAPPLLDGSAQRLRLKMGLSFFTLTSLARQKFIARAPERRSIDFDRLAQDRGGPNP
jgi:hypothetical protein